jgi:hypothetical protein
MPIFRLRNQLRTTPNLDKARDYINEKYGAGSTKAKEKIQQLEKNSNDYDAFVKLLEYQFDIIQGSIKDFHAKNLFQDEDDERYIFKWVMTQDADTRSLELFTTRECDLMPEHFKAVGADSNPSTQPGVSVVAFDVSTNPSSPGPAK